MVVPFVISRFLTVPSLRRWPLGSKWKTVKGGEREGGALQAKEAACLDAPNSPA